MNKTLQDLKVTEKPVITIFNKLDQYEKNTFDEWLEPEVRNQILEELRERWENETLGNCVFISAIERRNLEGLRATILNKVRQLYRERYPYKTEFYWSDEPQS